jgi:ATP-dependent DNA helicase DinG
LSAYINFADLKSERAQVDSGIARWISKKDIKGKAEKQSGVEFTLNSNLIHVKTSFQELFVEQFKSIILTSATIENLGSTDYFTGKLGIEKNSPTQKIKLFTSPFDYSQVKLNMPIATGNPNHEGHDFVVIKQITQLMARHSAILVLFTSNRALDNTFEKCPQSLKSNILCQHKYSKSNLISEHKKNIDAGKTSILFGVDGLSEGVDLAGDYLTSVVITKLPFENLADPLFKYEGMCIEMNKQSSFMTLSLPMCSQKLNQGVGRLIRTEKDYGEVVILDPRVNTKSYGQKLIESLPMYNETDASRAKTGSTFNSAKTLNPFIRPKHG